MMVRRRSGGAEGRGADGAF